jgi:SIR2-like domain
MNYEADANYRALVQVMKCKPRPLALLGAGTSVDSGYPDWNRLLAMLEERAQGVSPKYQTFLRELHDPAWQAEEYRRFIGEHAFRSLIASEFAPKKGKIGPILHAIVRLKFRHMLTTNYDSCIEDAYREAGAKLEVADWTEETNMRRFFFDLYRDGVTPYLVYLHGRYYDPANVILTESSYASRYVRSDDAQRKLFAILITQPVVFIGFSVNDPDLNHLMREVNARLGGGTTQHFALMGVVVEDQRLLIQNRFEGKYGIKPVFYRVNRAADGSENHSDLLVLLDRLQIDVFGQQLGEVERQVEPVADEDKESKVRARAAAPVSDQQGIAPRPIDPLDEQKGRWGGKAESNHRRLKVENIIENQHSCTFDLVVEPTKDAPTQLEGNVIFHLHQTFHPATRFVKVEGGQARLKLSAYGAFTVGVQADGDSTQLELDLSQIADFPRWFKES